MFSQTPQAERLRRIRAAYTPEQRATYLAEKRERAARDRADPDKRARQNAKSMECYYKAVSDPVKKAAISRSARERYWLNQEWRIAQEAKIRARKRGLPYDLTKEWVKETWTGFCALTGLPFRLRSTTITAYSPSIDRIDNAKGYTRDNCRWVLYGVNALKNVGTDADAFKIAQALVERMR